MAGLVADPFSPECDIKVEAIEADTACLEGLDLSANRSCAPFAGSIRFSVVCGVATHRSRKQFSLAGKAPTELQAGRQRWQHERPFCQTICTIGPKG
jgi:hypothetical protein